MRSRAVVIASLAWPASPPRSPPRPPSRRRGSSRSSTGATSPAGKCPPATTATGRCVDGVIDYDAQSEATGEKSLWTQKEYVDFVLRVEWRIKETPYVNPNVPIIRYDGTHKKGPDGKEIKLSVPDSDSGIYLRGSSKSQVNIWCWPIGSGELYGYRMDEKLPAAVRAGVTPKANADNDVGQWNAFEITMKGDRLSVVLNGVTVLENAELPGVPAEGPDRPPAPRLEEGRRLDGPARARPVPQHLDPGAEVAGLLERRSDRTEERTWQAGTKPPAVMGRAGRCGRPGP